MSSRLLDDVLIVAQTDTQTFNADVPATTIPPCSQQQKGHPEHTHIMMQGSTHTRPGNTRPGSKSAWIG